MEENRLNYALKCLQREDPTLRVEMNDEQNAGQTIIQGMRF
jgi:translation elongation factor EF-G